MNLRALLALFGGAGAACAGTTTQQAGQLPGDFVPVAIVEDAAGAALVFGHEGGASIPVTQRTAAIWRSGETASRAWGTEPGWFVAAARDGAQVWGVHTVKTPDNLGNRYTVLVSENGGQDWERRGEIPSESVTALAIGGDGWGWAGGVADLFRTTDGGRTWTPVSVPGSRGIQKPQFSALGTQGLLVNGPSLRRTSDGGESWETLTDSEVLATDGHWAVGRVEGGIRFGEVGTSSVSWGATYEADLLPDAIVSDGQRLLVRAAPVGKDVGRYVAVLVSEDGGETIETLKLRGPSATATVGLGLERVWRMEQSRALKVYDFKDE